MFRLWCKLFDESNHLMKDMVYACYTFDLSEPIWLDSNIADFQRHSKVRFTKDNFIDSIDFAYMEVQVIEED